MFGSEGQKKLNDPLNFCDVTFNFNTTELGRSKPCQAFYIYIYSIFVMICLPFINKAIFSYLWMTHYSAWWKSRLQCFKQKWPLVGIFFSLFWHATATQWRHMILRHVECQPPNSLINQVSLQLRFCKTSIWTWKCKINNK